MFEMRSASPLGAPILARKCLPLLVVVLALLLAGPAFSAGNGESEGSGPSETGAEAEPRQEDPPAEDPPAEEPPAEEPPAEEPPAEDPPEEEPELVSPPSSGNGSNNSQSSDRDSNPSALFGTTRTRDQAEQRFVSTRRELARLFVMTEKDISIEFPGGEFDRALVQAAKRARRAERTYRRF